MEKSWRLWAKEYDENDWPFSSAFAWEKVVSANPNAFNLLQYADQLRLCGYFSKSAEIFDEIVLDEIPDEYKFTYFVKKGRLFEDQGKMDEAILAYKSSIEAGTEMTYPYIFLAVRLSNQERVLEAKEYLIQALQKEGDIDEVYYNLGTSYAQLGDFENAIIAMQECIKLDPTYENAKAFLEDFKNMENIKGFQDQTR